MFHVLGCPPRVYRAVVNMPDERVGQAWSGGVVLVTNIELPSLISHKPLKGTKSIEAGDKRQRLDLLSGVSDKIQKVMTSQWVRKS